MKKIAINLYELRELSKEAQNRAIAAHKEFMIDTYSDGDFDESFNMTRSKYAKSLIKGDVIENIEANNYLYFANGELASVVEYCGGHPKAGKTEFALNGETYTI